MIPTSSLPRWVLARFEGTLGTTGKVYVGQVLRWESSGTFG